MEVCVSLGTVVDEAKHGFATDVAKPAAARGVVWVLKVKLKRAVAELVVVQRARRDGTALVQLFEAAELVVAHVPGGGSVAGLLAAVARERPVICCHPPEVVGRRVGAVAGDYLGMSASSGRHTC